MASGAEQQRWRQTEELFYQASELPPAERESFVELHCAGDDELMREVWSLLASADEPLEPLREPIRDAIEDLSGAPPGMVIGPYRILRLLGEGGMGKVYLATRADQQYQQQVAIKFMHAGQMAPRSLLLRFRSERQILADLNHPNIARMFDGGVTAEGVPYIVMEYVEGTPIHVHCREHHSTVAERLRLFLEVCAAVDYAHRHLVVHRDLKPANILVTAEGVPKLLDFGIAKLLEDGQDSEGASTRTLDRLLTPEYASPEQVEGKPVTTVTDVYGLGALLYELLAGRKPFRLDNIHSLEAARVICETLPELPGTAARDNPGAAPPDAHLVKGDLDRVAMMALRKEPERRYASALSLAADLEAWLAGYPVQARPATWSYVAARYVRRHRWAIGAAAVALLALIGFSAGMTLLKQRADRQQIIAAQQAEFLSGMFHAATPDVARGKQLTVREMLDLGAQRAEQQTGDSEVRASLLLSIGWSYRWLGYYEQALRLAKQSYAIQSRIYGENSEQSADSLDLLAGSYRDAEDYAHAEPLFRRLLDVRH
jgi:serine/threonine protein kinase